MKKIIIILTIFLFYNVPAHSDKLLKNGFLNNNMDYAKEQIIINPKDKIIIIYNHGQDDHDKPSKKTCVWKNGIRNPLVWCCISYVIKYLTQAHFIYNIYSCFPLIDILSLYALLIKNGYQIGKTV